MNMKKLLETVSYLQKEAEKYHNSELELYLSEDGVLNYQSISGQHEYKEGFYNLVSFGKNDIREPMNIIRQLETPDGFPHFKDWKLSEKINQELLYEYERI
jgi:hypothetical protein